MGMQKGRRAVGVRPAACGYGPLRIASSVGAAADETELNDSWHFQPSTTACTVRGAAWHEQQMHGKGYVRRCPTPSADLLTK